jgi:hypothetical protein
VDSLTSEENAWMQEKINTLKFSPDQVEILKRDMKTPPEIMPLLSKITSPADRGFLVNQVRQIAHLDSNMSLVERERIEILKNLVLSKLGMEIVVDEVNGIEPKDATTETSDPYYKTLKNFFS